jgi:hypothetical protein
MFESDVCTLNTARLDDDTSLPVIRATVEITGEDDVEEFGEIPPMQCLGVASLPFPASALGKAEGVVLRDTGNANGVLVGARDARCAPVVASMSDGDTIVHSVDPEAKAQLRCQANRQVVLASEDTGGDTMVINLDGKNDRIQIIGFGGIIELSKENGIAMTAPDGETTLSINNGKIMLSASEVFLSSNALGAVCTCPTAGGVPLPPGPVNTGVPAVNVFA